MSNAQMQWFREAKFGMFIHWGLYSLLGRGEWVKDYEAIPEKDYMKLAEDFRPAEGCAAEWAALAREAGMKYVVFTTKHHDGFCLFDSTLTDYCSTKTGLRRDYVREVVDAFRAEGIRIGLYHSIGDWHQPSYAALRSGDFSGLDTYKTYLHGQVRELLSNYGTIDLLWYDGAWFGENQYLSADALDMAALDALARELQPGIIINDRAGLEGDYSTPEHEFKPAPMGRDWEMCTCVNDLWGYGEHDYNYKTLNQLIFLLMNCAVNGGNLLLNIGPRADGSVPREQVERLQAMGAWLRTHGDAVYGCERLPSPYFGGGRVTRRDGTVYLHTVYWPGETMRVPVLTQDVLGVAPGEAPLAATILTTGQSVNTHWDGTTLVLTGLPQTPPDSCDTVIALRS